MSVRILAAHVSLLLQVNTGVSIYDNDLQHIVFSGNYHSIANIMVFYLWPLVVSSHNTRGQCRLVVLI